MKCEMPLCNKDDNIIHVTQHGKLCDRCYHWMLKRRSVKIEFTAECHTPAKLLTGRRSEHRNLAWLGTRRLS
jgi:hypothetical protein